MKKAFLLGIVIAALGVIVGVVSGNLFLTEKACGTFSVACLIVMGILKVTFKGSNKYIGHYSSEMKKRIEFRKKISDYLFAIVTPNILTTIVTYIIFG